MPADLLTLAAEASHQVAILPLAVLGLLRLMGRRRDAGYWWLAAAFAVSWVADWSAHWWPGETVSRVYPVVQYGLAFLALAPRPVAWSWFVVTAGCALVAVTASAGAESISRLVGSLGVLWMVRDRPASAFGTALFVYFGVGTAAWVLLVWQRSVVLWLVYQACRWIGLGIFTGGVYRDDARPAVAVPC